MSYDLINKVVLVTGGANGIGSCVVRYALEEGAKHVAILDISVNGVEFAKELNNKHGAGKAKYYECDVTDEKLLKDTFDEIKKENEYLDVVVNNAGILNDSLQAYRKEIEINFLALVTATLKALELMRQDEGGKGGTVINISSAGALVQSVVFPIYFATKSAVLQFSNIIGMDDYYSRTNVRVLTVCFSATDTSLMQRTKYANFDKVIDDYIPEYFKAWPFQSVEAAARGVIDTFKKGESGSTWLVENNNPVKDITDNIKRGYKAFAENIFTHKSEED